MALLSVGACLTPRSLTANRSQCPEASDSQGDAVAPAGGVSGSGRMLWPHGSGAITSQLTFGSEDIGQHLAATNALLAARAGPGLDGVEVGPMLGSGSYGRVYRCACCSPLPHVRPWYASVYWHGCRCSCRCGWGYWCR